MNLTDCPNLSTSLWNLAVDQTTYTSQYNLKILNTQPTLK